MELYYINDDCFEYMKSISDNSIDLIVTDPPYGISFNASNHMENVDWDKMSSDEYENFLDKFLSECRRVLKPEGSMWMFYGITMIESVIKSVNKSGLYNHWENALVFTTPEKTLQYYHLTKNEKNYVFNQIEIKRDVVVPYVTKTKDGKKIKRGWDYENGKAKRFTGIGNCLYASNPSWINQIFSLISSKENDVVISLPSGNKIIRDYNSLFNQISTSEDCKLGFNRRLFLPKLT